MYRVEPLVRDDRGRVVQSAIIRTDLATGVESELHRDNIGLMALSPDDRTIVFLSRSDRPTTVKVISTAGGTPRHLTDLVYRGERVRLNGLVWTPDGDSVLTFGRCCGAVQLFRVSATGGDLEPAGLVNMLPEEADQAKDPDVIFQLRALQIRPDGRQISFAGQRILGPPAVWALEDFLPASSEVR